MKTKSTFLIPALCLILLSFSSKAQNQFEVLIFAEDDGYHLDNIPTVIEAFKSLSRQHSFGLEWAMDPEIFTSEDMAEFDVVVFLNADGDPFSEEQRAGFKKFINEGGGYVGIHGASTTKDKWPWYDQLVGRVFTDHPPVQTGILKVVEPDFPATWHLKKKWMWTDEWYNFSKAKVDDLNILLQVDESSYDVGMGYGNPESAMGDFHPIAWYHEFDGGRAFYSALGHIPESFQDKNHLDFLYGGIYWAATGRNGK